jgi:hypothetical protein
LDDLVYEVVAGRCGCAVLALEQAPSPQVARRRPVSDAERGPDRPNMTPNDITETSVSSGARQAG